MKIDTIDLYQNKQPIGLYQNLFIYRGDECRGYLAKTTLRRARFLFLMLSFAAIAEKEMNNAEKEMNNA